MKNFTIILFIFLCLFLVVYIFTIDLLPLFLTIFLAFIIAFICLASYLGKIRGILCGLIFIFLPFLLEYLFYLYKIPFFYSPVIKFLSRSEIRLPLTLNNLFLVFTIPLLFMASLFLSQKIKSFSNLKNYHQTFLVIISSLLLAITFLSFTQNQLDYLNFFKWLIIGLIINSLLVKLYKFNPKTAETFKELPIIIYLAIFATSALKRMDNLQLLIVGILTFIYLLLLYYEYKFKKIKTAFPH
jgi:hypothetical protein